MQDVWAGRREALRNALALSLDALEFQYGELVREQVEASPSSDFETPALACLAAAEAAGGTAEAAMPAAVSLAFLAQMTLVFARLENTGGAASLSTAWGMPRALNAGDAMFALAQDTLLSAPDELTAEQRMEATRMLDKGARALVDALLDCPEAEVAVVGQRTLLATALGLGGLFGGASHEVRERLEGLGREWSMLPADELSRRLAGGPRSWLAT